MNGAPSVNEMIEFWNREARRQHLTVKGNVGVTTVMNNTER